MKITKRKTKTGATVRITATSSADKQILTEAVLSGSLVKELNKINGLGVKVSQVK